MFMWESTTRRRAREMTVRYYVPAAMGKERYTFSGDVGEILDAREFTKGERARRLARSIGDITGYEYAIPMGQGTHAIFILARWFKHNGFDKIRVPAFTWPSTYLPFQWLGFDVEYVDIDAETWLPDFSGHEDRPGTSLDCPVDTFGNVYPNSGNHLWVDSAQSLGAKWDTTEPTRIVSLSGSKIVTSGEGGILLTQDKHLAEFANAQRGWLSRLPEISAALGLAYLTRLPEIVERKADIAKTYRGALKNVVWQRVPVATNNYIVAGLVQDREAFFRTNSGVEFRKYYDTIVNEVDERQSLYADADAVGGPDLPKTKYVAQHIVAFPSWPEMKLDDVRSVRE